MTAYKLYWRKGSGSLIAHIALAMCGADVERIEVPTKAEQRSAAFLAINPAAQIPVLVLPDGTVIAETAAILIILAERYPESGILPPVGSSARALSLRWLMYLATTGYSAALRSYYSDRYSGDPSAEACEAVRNAADAEQDRVFAVLAAAIEGPFVLGDKPTIVDAYLAMLADWHPPALDLAPIRRLYDGLLADPVIGKAWQGHEQAV